MDEALLTWDSVLALFRDGWTADEYRSELMMTRALPEAPHIQIRVLTRLSVSTQLAQSYSRPLRVWAVDTKTERGFIRSVEVPQGEGWELRLLEAIVKVGQDARERVRRIREDAGIGADPSVPAPSFPAVMERLRTAVANGLKRPRLRFRTPGGQTIQIKLNTTGPNEGKANISDGKPFGQGVWFGRIAHDGVLERRTESYGRVAEFMARLSEDLIATAALYGRTTGECCFCARELTTKESLAVGYGPVCAAHWNLPWGES